MYSQFVIYAHPRTGSYNLMSLLDSCEDIACYGELFKAPKIELPKYRITKLINQTPEARDAHPEAFIKEVRSYTPRKNFGFKVFEQHMKRVRYLRSLFKSADWKPIALFRDPIETYASLVRANRTSVWTLRENREIDPAVLNMPVDFAEESFVTFAQVYRSFLAECQRLGERGAFVIRYEQVGDPDVMAQMLRYIGSKAKADDMKSEYRRQFSGKIEEAFTNWAELADYVKKHDPFPETPTTTVPWRAD